MWLAIWMGGFWHGYSRERFEDVPQIIHLAKEMTETYADLFDLWNKGRVHDPNAAALAAITLRFRDLGEDCGRGHLGTHLANINCFMLMTPEDT